MQLPICPVPIMPTLRMGIISFSCGEAGSAEIPFAPRTMSSIVIPHSPAGSIACLFQLGVELGQDREQIADEAIVGNLEDWGLGILVDRDDYLGILHAGEMLDGARDTDGDVELRRHHLAGLADLVVVRHVAGIDRGSARASRRAEAIGKRLDQGLEVLARLHAAATGNDDACGSELGPFADADVALLETRKPEWRRRRDRLDRRGSALARGGKSRDA